MATWTYADWIQYDGDDRLTRLRLHITEVSQRTMGTNSRAHGVTAVDPQYLGKLMAEEKLLLNQLRGRNLSFNNTRFSRGDD